MTLYNVMLEGTDEDSPFLVTIEVIGVDKNQANTHALAGS